MLRLIVHMLTMKKHTRSGREQDAGKQQVAGHKQCNLEFGMTVATCSVKTFPMIKPQLSYIRSKHRPRPTPHARVQHGHQEQYTRFHTCIDSSYPGGRCDCTGLRLLHEVLGRINVNPTKLQRPIATDKPLTPVVGAYSRLSRVISTLCGRGGAPGMGPASGAP
jgi:hypothetical protein